MLGAADDEAASLPVVYPPNQGREDLYTSYEALAEQLSSALETEVSYADYLYCAFQRDMSREVTQTALGFCASRS